MTTPSQGVVKTQLPNMPGRLTRRRLLQLNALQAGLGLSKGTAQVRWALVGLSPQQQQGRCWTHLKYWLPFGSVPTCTSLVIRLFRLCHAFDSRLPALLPDMLLCVLQGRCTPASRPVQTP